VFINTSSFVPPGTSHVWAPLVVTLQSSIKIAYFTDVEKEKCVLQFEQNHLATLVQWWLCTNYGKEEHTRNSIYKWHKTLLKLVAFLVRKRIWADDQVMRLCSMFMHNFSIVHRNPHG
jgi:hypothetical protein